MKIEKIGGLPPAHLPGLLGLNYLIEFRSLYSLSWCTFSTLLCGKALKPGRWTGLVRFISLLLYMKQQPILSGAGLSGTIALLLMRGWDRGNGWGFEVVLPGFG